MSDPIYNIFTEPCKEWMCFSRALEKGGLVTAAAVKESRISLSHNSLLVTLGLTPPLSLPPFLTTRRRRMPWLFIHSFVTLCGSAKVRYIAIGDPQIHSVHPHRASLLTGLDRLRAVVGEGREAP